MFNRLRDEVKQPAGRAALVFVAVLGLIWIALVSGDWVMRFRWFQWHRSLVQGPARPTYMGYAAPLSTNHVSAQRGDLVSMLGVPRLMDRYADKVPGFTQINDEFGLSNISPVTPGKFPVVLTGDSFLLQGGDMTNRPAGQLAARLGQPVYTMAFAGLGPVIPLSAFMDHPVFRVQPPRVMVWCLIERDIGGIYFEGMLFNVLSRTQTNRAVANVPALANHINWTDLGAARLRKRLPETSLSAQFARRGWALIRYFVFGLIVPEVSISAEPVLGRKMLFYRWSLVPRCWDPSIRDLPRVTRTIVNANDAYFKPRGIEWVILLIPDKETVYEEHVPREAFPCDPVPPSCLIELEQLLRGAGIHVVNLLPTYRSAAQQGHLIFWPGDTHWNSEGITLAADVLAGPVLELLAEKP